MFSHRLAPGFALATCLTTWPVGDEGKAHQVRWEAEGVEARYFAPGFLLPGGGAPMGDAVAIWEAAEAEGWEAAGSE